MGRALHTADPLAINVQPTDVRALDTANSHTIAESNFMGRAVHTTNPHATLNTGALYPGHQAQTDLATIWALAPSHDHRYHSNISPDSNKTHHPQIPGDYSTYLLPGLSNVLSHPFPKAET